MENCIFCQIVNGSAPCWKVYESEHSLAFFDINPITPYHTLVVPKKHFVNMFDIPEAELSAVISAVKAVIKRYELKIGMQDVQVLSNSGTEAQQDVFHLHFHLIPRTQGDGQNIRWRTHPEWRSDFDEMLAKLH